MSGSARTFAADLDADLTSADRLLWVDRGIALGTFRARPRDAVFSSAKQLRCCYLVFPRTSSEIRLDRGPASVHTPLHVVAYNAGDAYRRFAVSSQGDASDYIAIAPDVLRRFVQDEFGVEGDGGKPLFGCFSAMQTRSLFLRQRRLFDRLLARGPAVMGVEAVETPAADAPATQEAVMDLLLSAIASGVAEVPSQSQPSALRQRTVAEEVKRHVGRHFCERLDLAQLARLAGVSPGHLTRSFRRQVGMSIHQFVIELRLRESLELLPQMRNIADVAAQLGFAHHSHFTAAFGRAFGTTPSAYVLGAPRGSGRRRLSDRLEGSRMTGRRAARW